MSTSKKNVLKFEQKKSPICKAFECSDSASIKGFCRLHYLMKLKGSEKLFGESTPVSEKKKNTSHRLKLFNQSETDTIDAAADEYVQKLNDIEGQTPTSMLDLEDLNPFKKTGS